MIPLIVFLAGFAILMLCAQMGLRMGAFLALSGMLGTMIGTLAAMRYWFFASDAVEIDTAPVLLHTVLVFWTIFIAVAFLFSRLRQLFTDVFESTRPSILNRIMGALFGAGTGMILMMSVTMTISILLPEFVPGYDHTKLPVPVDEWAPQAYQYIETHVAGIAPNTPGHTLLPPVGAKPTTQLQAWK